MEYNIATSGHLLEKICTLLQSQWRAWMAEVFNVYCDESCHLENDRQKIMLLGAVWCPANKVREITDRIREIKADHGLSPRFESKWTKVSPAKIQFYRDLMDFFSTTILPVCQIARASGLRSGSTSRLGETTRKTRL